MKTVKQLADENNVSAQTIYRVLNRVKQETGKCLTEKINGITYIPTKNEALITERLTPVKQVLNDVKQVENEEVLFLRRQNQKLSDELIKERNHSREQTDKILDLANQLAELNRNNQILLGSEQTRNSQTSQSFLDDGEEVTSVNDSVKNQGFFSKLFKKNKRIV